MSTTLRVGVAETDITPWFGVELSGYGFFLDRKGDSVHERILAQAIAFEAGDRTALIISADLIGYDHTHVQNLRRQISESTGIDPAGIVFSATHTHAGPATIFLHGCGSVDQTYIDFLTKRLVNLAEMARSQLERATLATASLPLPGVAYNRTRSDGPVDDLMQCLFVEDAQGNLRAVLTRFSCHPVVFRNDNSRISPDFVGAFRRALRRQWPEIVPFYLQGACGDLNPNVSAYPGEPATALEGIGLAVAGGVLQLYGRRTPVDVDGIDAATTVVDLPHAELTPADVEAFAASIAPKDGARGAGARGRARFAHEAEDTFKKLIAQGALSQTDSVELKSLRLGPLTFLFHGAELFSGPAIEMRKRMQDLWVVGYSNDFWGYVPDAVDFERKGYAAVTVPYMVHKAPYTPDVADVLVKKALTFLKH